MSEIIFKEEISFSTIFFHFFSLDRSLFVCTWAFKVTKMNEFDSTAFHKQHGIFPIKLNSCIFYEACWIGVEASNVNHQATLLRGNCYMMTTGSILKWLHDWRHFRLKFRQITFLDLIEKMNVIKVHNICQCNLIGKLPSINTPKINIPFFMRENVLTMFLINQIRSFSKPQVKLQKTSTPTEFRTYFAHVIGICKGSFKI